jgi:hypothetical protein
MSEPTRRTGGDPRVTAVVVAVLAIITIGVAVWLLRPDPPVVVIGDSITAGAEHTLRDQLGTDFALTIDGRPGYRVAEQLPTARNAAGFPFEQVVVNLGTNDVMGADQALDASLASISEIVTLFPEADCIHLVTVSEQMVSGSVDAPARAAAFNDGLEAIVATDPRVSLIDWSGIVAGWQADHPGELLTTDTVHPTDEGNELLVAAYGDALSGCQPPR